MPGLAASSKDLDYEHAPTAARARLWQDRRLVGFIRFGASIALRLFCRAGRSGEQLAGARNVGDALTRRRLRFGVPQQRLDGANVAAALEQMGGKAVPQPV
jgi:hypothetical protein